MTIIFPRQKQGSGMQLEAVHELFFCEVDGKKWRGFYGISLFSNGRLPLPKMAVQRG